MSKIPILEIFGATVQGEGEMIGAKTMFVRTAGCDYSCSWCDSKFTWDGSVKADMMAPRDVFDELERIAKDNYEIVTISGGNPALIGNPMKEFIEILKQNNKKTALETQGSKFQNWFNDIDFLTISPKPPSSRMVTDFIVLDSVIEQTSKEIVNLKIVIFDSIDYQFAKTVHKRYPSMKMYLQVGNEDTISRDTDTNSLLKKLEWLIEKVIDDKEMNKVKILPQLHTLLWGNKRGV